MRVVAEPEVTARDARGERVVARAAAELLQREEEREGQGTTKRVGALDLRGGLQDGQDEVPEGVLDPVDALLVDERRGGACDGLAERGEVAGGDAVDVVAVLLPTILDVRRSVAVPVSPMNAGDGERHGARPVCGLHRAWRRRRGEPAARRDARARRGAATS